MNLKPYSAYKDSGVSWIGEIPNHWESIALHYVSCLKSGEAITALQFDENGKYPVYGGNGYRGNYDKFTHNGEFVLIGRQGALCGNINIAKGRFFASEHAIVVNPQKKFSIHWMGYQLLSMNLNQYSVAAAQPGLSAETIGRLKITFPPIEEQKQIADYLDKKTSHIDLLIAKKKELLEKLAENRIALISNAVTKGIDSSAQMKDSGVSWIGEIPNHWETATLRRLLIEPLTNGLFKKREHWGIGTKIVNVFDVYVKNDVINESSLDRVFCDDLELKKYQVKHGDFLFVRSSLKLEGIGKSAFIINPTEPMVFECHLVRGCPNTNLINPLYLCYFLNSNYSRESLIILSNQVTMATIDQEKFKSLFITFPNLEEQKQIADYLDNQTNKIDHQINKIKKAIDLLQEYRSSLITHAVTGKIDIRDLKQLPIIKEMAF